MKVLERRLGLSSAVAISLAAMLGSGLFVLPGLAVVYTGPSLFLAYLVAGLCVVPAALSKAELATSMPQSGGSYVFIARTFGPLAGMIFGLGLWFSLMLKSAFALVGFGAYLHVFSDLPLKATSLTLLSAIVVINLLGVGKVARAQVALVGVTVVGLVFYAGVGFRSFDSDNLTPLFTGGSDGFITAVAFVYIAFAGLTKIAAIGEEVKQPGRNLPLAILISLCVVTVLYGIVTLAMVSAIPMSALRGDLRPIFTLARYTAGPALATGAAILGVLTMTSMANAGVLASSRFPMAMSRDNLLHPVFRQIHSKYLTPVWCILVTGILMAVAILTLDVARIAKLASSFKIVVFIAINATVIVLRETAPQWYKPPFRSPLYPWMQVAGIVVGLVLLWMLGLVGAAAVLCITVTGSVMYLLYGRHRALQIGVFRMFSKRPKLVESTLIRLKTEEESDELPENAAVVVSLFGDREHSPETLVEIGGGLAHGAIVEVIHVRGVPEQTPLEAVAEGDEDLVAGLQRRIETLAMQEGFNVEFDNVVTHDQLESVNEITSRVHCEWLVLEWFSRSDQQMTRTNPLGWLIDHLSCDLALFKDKGVRNIKKMLVLIEDDEQCDLVVEAANNLARAFHANISLATYLHSNTSLEEREVARARLQRVAARCMVAEEDQHLLINSDLVQSIAHATVEADLLVMGDSDRVRLRDLLFETEKDHLTRVAACSVLRLKTRRFGSRHTGPTRS